MLLAADIEKAFEYEHIVPTSRLEFALRAASFVLFRPGMTAVAGFRLASQLDAIGLGPLAQIAARITTIFTGSELPPTATIGPGLVIYHPVGVVIHAGARVGSNLRIHTGAVIGTRSGIGRSSEASPSIGNDVLIGAGAKVLGEIEVGDWVRIGANAVVTENVDPGTTVVGAGVRAVTR